MKQFNLEDWLQDKSRKVVTRDGRPVRILDYNLKGDEPICIAVDDKTQESITTVDEDGHCLKDKTGWHESNFDLFFADEEELTEFEKRFIELIRLWMSGNTNPEENLIQSRFDAKELFDLARKELQSEFDKELDKAYKTQDIVVFCNGYAQGKQDTLKVALESLPKLKKAKEDRVLACWVVKLNKDGNITFSDVVYKGEYFITFQSLKTLPKEE